MKKKLIIIFLIILLITSIVLMDTYALFETNANASKVLTTGKWIIEINGEDITETDSITLGVEDFVYDNSVHTQDGYFAPGSDVYFDIEIDASETDVSIIYEISIDDSALEDHPNITFSVEDLDTNQEVDEFPMTGTLLLSGNDMTKTLRVHLTWEDDSDYDEDDTLLIGEELEFTITANFKQYLVS